LHAQESAITSMNSTIDATNQAAKLAHEVELLSAGISLCDAGRVDYLALLGELSRITPPGMRIAEITTGTVREATELTLRGTVIVSDDQPDPLSPFLESLRSSPVIASVDLGSTRLSEESGKRVKDFTLTARLRAAHSRLTGAAR
jgi:Tfp pilus assembly protein PilN